MGFSTHAQEKESRLGEKQIADVRLAAKIGNEVGSGRIPGPKRPTAHGPRCRQGQRCDWPLWGTERRGRERARTKKMSRPRLNYV